MEEAVGNESANGRSDPTVWNRRRVLGAVAAAAAVSGLPGRPALAAPAPVRLALGDAEVTVLSDGGLVLPMGFYLPETPQVEIDALLTPHGLPTDMVRPDCNLTLLRTGDRVVLFDAGAGPLFQETAGKLPESLSAAGVAPDEITDVCFTHAHPDHLWGVIDDFDEPVFPNARFWMNRMEWDFWRAPETLDAMPEARKSFVVGAQNRMDVIEPQVTLFDAGAEVVPGVEAVASFGHTAGHCSFMIHGGDGLLVVGDAIANAVISFERPDWHAGSDQDPAAGAATRGRLLDRLTADKARILGFHLPYPGIGSVERKGAHYRFAPAG
jgi:glyoxylase-like metal-dependent hydrolase (beta-lactamase superfamily II)